MQTIQAIQYHIQVTLLSKIEQAIEKIRKQLSKGNRLNKGEKLSLKNKSDRMQFLYV